jgi:hypothetical protein
MIRIKWAALLTMTSVAAMVLAPATAGAASGARPTVAAGGGFAAPAFTTSRGVNLPDTRTLSANPTSMWPPSALCSAVGLSLPTSTGLTGIQFPASAAFTVTYHGHRVATGTTTTRGRLTATASDFSQPDGTYNMVAVASMKKAATPVYSGGDSCWESTGTASSMTFKWQVQGFDPATTAEFIVNNAVFETATTSSKGAAFVKFTKACPGTGTFNVDVKGIFAGVPDEFGAGSFNC